MDIQWQGQGSTQRYSQYGRFECTISCHDGLDLRCLADCADRHSSARRPIKGSVVRGRDHFQRAVCHGYEFARSSVGRYASGVVQRISCGAGRVPGKPAVGILKRLDEYVREVSIDLRSIILKVEVLIATHTE